MDFNRPSYKSRTTVVTLQNLNLCNSRCSIFVAVARKTIRVESLLQQAAHSAVPDYLQRLNPALAADQPQSHYRQNRNLLLVTICPENVPPPQNIEWYPHIDSTYVSCRILHLN